jgi:hypothetical protein
LLVKFPIGYNGGMNSFARRACAAIACAVSALPALGQPDRCASAARSLPARAASAPSGSEFARRVADLSGPERDKMIAAEIRAGNLPQHLRHARAVTLVSARAGGPSRVTLCVLPDYLAVGDDEDYLLVPLGLQAALSLAAEFGFELPTRRMVDAIHRQAALRLEPRPLPANDAMRTTAYVELHNALVRQQRADSGAALDVLTAGHKKDLVLTPRLEAMPGRVAIYGWHRRDGRPIQPLSLVHGARYADYSHGVRFVSATAWVDGAPRPLGDLLAHEQTAALVSDEGPLALPAGFDTVAQIAGAP